MRELLPSLPPFVHHYYLSYHVWYFQHEDHPYQIDQNLLQSRWIFFNDDMQLLGIAMMKIVFLQSNVQLEIFPRCVSNKYIDGGDRLVGLARY